MTEYERRPAKPKQSAMKNNGIGDCYANLAAAIVEQACRDYVDTPSGIFERTKRDCERFFLSDWFHLLSGGAVDGERAIVALRERRRQRLERERERKRMERERRKEREGVANEER